MGTLTVTHCRSESCQIRTSTMSCSCSGAKNPGELKFHQAVEEVLDSLVLLSPNVLKCRTLAFSNG